MAEQNAYAILNIHKGASQEEIKQAWATLVKQYDNERHPERFAVIQAAFEKLEDPQKRAHEDVLTYNYIRSDFNWTDEEKVKEDVPVITDRIHKLLEAMQQGNDNPQIKPALISNYQRLSYQHAQVKHWKEAIEDWQSILKIDATHQRAKHNLISAYISLGYHYASHELTDDAVQLWEAALKMDPGSTETVHNLAIASEKAEDHQRAQRYWTETIKRWKEKLDKNPNDVYIRQCLMEAHRHSGGKALQSVQTDETKEQRIDSYRQVLSMDPDDFEARYGLAGALVEDKKFAEAITELKLLQQQHPRSLDVVNQLGWAYLNSGKFEMAFSTWKRALIADPKALGIKDSMMRARLAVGKKLKEGGHYIQALVHFKELQKLLPNAWEVHLEIAETMLRKGDRRTALIEYQRVLELDPKNKVAKRAISDIRMRS